MTVEPVEELTKLCSECLATIPQDSKTCPKCKTIILQGIDIYKELVDIIGITVRDDERFIEHNLQTCMSAYTGNPNNLKSEAPTSEGKTYGSIQTANLFPEENVWNLAGLSPTAIANDYGILINNEGESIQPKLDELYDLIDDEKFKTKKQRDNKKIREWKRQIRSITREAIYLINLDNIIMIFLDDPHSLTIQKLRPIMSHDKAEIDYKIAQPQGGRGGWRTRRVRIQGWPAFILITAKGEQRKSEADQISSRFITVAPKMSKKKYREAIKFMANSEGLPTSLFYKKFNLRVKKKYARKIIRRIRDELISLKNKARQQTGNYKVTITWFPFKDYIGNELPANKGRNMRDSEKFWRSLRTIALINIFSRPRIIIGEEESVIITAQDYARAVDLYFEDKSERSVIFTGIPRHIMDFFYKVVIPLSLEKGEKNSFLMTEMVDRCYEALDKTLSSSSIRKNYLPYLENEGLMDTRRDPDFKSRNIFRVLKTDVTDEKTGYLGINSKSPIFSLEKLKETWNEVNQLKDSKDEIYIQNFDGRRITIDELFTLHYSTFGSYISSSSKPQGNEETSSEIGDNNEIPKIPLISELLDDLIQHFGHEKFDKKDLIKEVIARGRTKADAEKIWEIAKKQFRLIMQLGGGYKFR